MATDFSKAQAARQALDASLTIYAEKDKAHADAVIAQEQAAAALVTAQEAVTTAETAKAEADSDAETALAAYLAELSAVGIDAGTPPAVRSEGKAKRKYAKRTK